ncbi:hypothetical protein AAG906_007939 [Vitis piasezkii]
MALPPETERMLIALEAFLDAPPPPCSFCCTRCHHYVTSDLNLIQDLYPFSLTELLFEPDVTGVMHGEYDQPLQGQYVGSFPEWGHVDLVAIYCIPCGNWLGWKIILQHADHPVIREGQFILRYGAGAGIEAVFHMENFL